MKRKLEGVWKVLCRNDVFSLQYKSLCVSLKIATISRIVNVFWPRGSANTSDPHRVDFRRYSPS